MPLTNYARQKIMMSVIGRTYFGNQSYSPSSGNVFYLALSTTAPNANGGNVSEPASNVGYARVGIGVTAFTNQSIFPDNPTYDQVNDKYSITNQADIQFPEATGSWGTITHFAIYDARTGGNVIAYGALNSSITPAANTVPIVRAGQMTVSEETAS